VADSINSNHDGGVIQAFVEADDSANGPPQAVELGDVLLGAFRGVPELRVAHLGLQGLYFALLLFDVKETSTSSRRAS